MCFAEILNVGKCRINFDPAIRECYLNVSVVLSSYLSYNRDIILSGIQIGGATSKM